MPHQQHHHQQQQPQRRRSSDAMFRLFGEILFLICCSFGFLFQVYHVSAIYFSYSTNSRVQRTVHENFTTPDVAACVDYEEVMDWDAYRSKYPNSTRRLTTNDIFDFTPKVNEMIAASFHRHESVFRIIRSMKDTDSYKHFFVKKFFMANSICYTMGLVVNPVISFPKVSVSLHEQHTFYGIQLSDRLSSVSKLHVTVFYGGLPYTSRLYSPTIDRRRSRQIPNPAPGQVLVSEYMFSYIRNAVSLLETPYDTGCTRGSGKKTRCTSECLIERLAAIGRVPFQLTSKQGSDKPPVTKEDIEDDEKIGVIAESDEYCANLCTEKPCDYDYTTTSLAGERHSLVEGSGNSSSIWIKVMTPAAPGLDIHTDPKIPLTEYLIYVCSIFGIWFGISIYSMNPLRLISTRVRKCCCQEEREEDEEKDGPGQRNDLRTRVLSVASITIIVERSASTSSRQQRSRPVPLVGCL